MAVPLELCIISRQETSNKNTTTTATTTPTTTTSAAAAAAAAAATTKGKENLDFSVCCQIHFHVEDASCIDGIVPDKLS